MLILNDNTLDVLRTIAQMQRVEDDAGRVNARIQERTGLDVVKVSSALGKLADEGLIGRDITGKRTFAVWITKEGRVAAENPYFGLGTTRALRYAVVDEGYAFEAKPGKLGSLIVGYLSERGIAPTATTAITAVRTLEDDPEVEVVRNGDGSRSYHVAIRPANLDPSAENMPVDVEPSEEEIYAEELHEQNKALGVDEWMPVNESAVVPPIGDGVDYGRLADVLLERVIELATSTEQVNHNVEALRAALDNKQAEVAAMNREHAALERQFTQLKIDHEKLVGRYNTACQERNRLEQIVRNMPQRRSGNGLKAEDRATLARLAKELPRG